MNNIFFKDDDMDEEMRQVLRMSLLEAEGNTAEAERLRQTLHQKSNPGSIPAPISSGASPSHVGSMPRSKVEQLKNRALMSADDTFPSLTGFRQMPTR